MRAMIGLTTNDEIVVFKMPPKLSKEDALYLAAQLIIMTGTSRDEFEQVFSKVEDE